MRQRGDKSRCRWIVWVVLLLGIFQSTQACTVVDDEKQTLHLVHPAQRIISLAPDLTELLFAAGAGTHIVGVMRGSDYPAPQVKQIPIVASYNQIDVEHIVLLHPDLIVAWAESRLPEQLKKLGIPIYLSHQHKLTDIPRTLQRLGCLAGTSQVANKAAMDFMQQYHRLQKKYAGQKSVSVFYEVWPQPLMTITGASWINDVITLCGGRNIFANLRGVSPEINMEAVIHENPDVIIINESGSDWQKQWREWPELLAVKQKQLYFIDPNLIERAVQRILNGAEKMCNIIAAVRSQ
jgi:iron complex transport system substrate-binding protein